MVCGIEGCSGRSARYGQVPAPEGERRFIPMCWPHYRLLVLREEPEREMDSRPIAWAEGPAS